jgi:hypothetical protein
MIAVHHDHISLLAKTTLPRSGRLVRTPALVLMLVMIVKWKYSPVKQSARHAKNQTSTCRVCAQAHGLQSLKTISRLDDGRRDAWCVGPTCERHRSKPL